MVDRRKDSPRFVGDQIVRAVIRSLRNPWTPSSEIMQSFYVLDNGALVATDAEIGRYVEIGFGAVVGAHCVLGSGVVLGDMVRIESFTTIGDCVKIRSHTSVGSGCRVLGGCEIGHRCYIGDGNTLAGGTRLGSGILIPPRMLGPEGDDQMFDALEDGTVIIDSAVPLHRIVRVED